MLGLQGSGKTTSSAKLAKRLTQKDKKRVLPCAALCEGEFGVNGYFIGVPTVIGENGIEKILDFKLLDDEKAELDKTLKAVKNTVEETGL